MLCSWRHVLTIQTPCRQQAAGEGEGPPSHCLFGKLCSHLLRQTGAGTGEVLHVRLGAALPLVQDEVRGHLALQAGDVAMAEVVAQVVHLWGRQFRVGQWPLLHEKPPCVSPRNLISSSAPQPSRAPADGSEEPVWPGSSARRRPFLSTHIHAMRSRSEFTLPVF